MKFETLEKLVKRNKKAVSTAIPLLLILALLSVILIPESTEADTNLKTSSSLDYIEDNKLGEAIIQRNSDFPRFLEEPDYRACIYSGTNTSPVILDMETEKVLISTDRIEVLDLNLTVPESEIDRKFPQQEVNISLRDRCPLRGKPQIVVKKE
jgi:hypothetical protein